MKVVRYGLTRYLDFVKEKLTTVLFFALIIHLVISFFVVLNLPFYKHSRLAIFYKIYLLPGPFFTDSKIVDNRSLYVSWKTNDTWSVPINPAKENFNQYHRTLNPSTLYKSRLCQTIRQMLPDSAESKINEEKEFLPVKQFLYDEYIAKEADTVRLSIVNKQVKNFKVRKDSTQLILFR